MNTSEEQLTQWAVEVLQSVTGRPAGPDTSITDELSSLQLMQFLLAFGKRCKVRPSFDALRAEDFATVRKFVSAVLGGGGYCGWTNDAKP